MSKYDDLCRIYANSRNHYVEYREECFDFAEKLVKGLIDYFAIPGEYVKLFPTLDEVKPDTTYTIKEAMLLAPNNFWHLGIEIKLCPEDDKKTPPQAILINLGIKKEDGRFLVKTGEKDKGYRIRKENRAEYDSLYENLYQVIKDYLETSVKRFVEKQPTVCKIGFMSECE